MQHVDHGQAGGEVGQRGAGAIAVQLRYPHARLGAHAASAGAAGLGNQTASGVGPQRTTACTGHTSSITHVRGSGRVECSSG